MACGAFCDRGLEDAMLAELIVGQHLQRQPTREFGAAPAGVRAAQRSAQASRNGETEQSRGLVLTTREDARAQR